MLQLLLVWILAQRQSLLLHTLPPLLLAVIVTAWRLVVLLLLLVVGWLLMAGVSPPPQLLLVAAAVLARLCRSVCECCTCLGHWTQAALTAAAAAAVVVLLGLTTHRAARGLGLTAQQLARLGLILQLLPRVKTTLQRPVLESTSSSLIARTYREH